MRCPFDSRMEINMIYVYLAQGFEETEMIFPLDLMRRAGLDVATVSVTECKEVTGSHGITVKADMSVNDAQYDVSKAQMFVLPGGMPGTINLENSRYVQQAIKHAAETDKYLCAICAAPSVLGNAGVLNGRTAVCYPGFEKYLTGATVPADTKCVRDGKIITAMGCGAAMEFGLAIVTELCGKDKADSIKNGIYA